MQGSVIRIQRATAYFHEFVDVWSDSVPDFLDDIDEDINELEADLLARFNNVFSTETIYQRGEDVREMHFWFG